MKRLMYILFSILTVFILLIGCSSEVIFQNEQEEINHVEDANQTLKVSYINSLAGIAKEYAVKYMELHPGVTINAEITTMERNHTAIMAGNGPDIFDGIYGLPYGDLRDDSVIKLLTDFYPIMKADSEFNEDDYYMNVFKAMSNKNGLYILPIQFSNILISVNKNVSNELTQKFSEYESVSIYDLLELRKAYPEAQDYYLYKNFNIREPILMEFSSFVNLNNRTCDFNNQKFIKLIADSKAAAVEDDLYTGTSGSIYSPLEEAKYGKKYLFQDTGDNTYQYIVTCWEQSIFSKATPLANSFGETAIQPYIAYCLSANSKNKELAWDFLKFMLSVEAHDDETALEVLYYTPVSKSLVRYKMELEMPKYFGYFDRHFNWKIDSREAEVQIQNAIEWFESVCNMPKFNSWSDSEIKYGDLLERFNFGQITAEQFASELQNKVSLILME